MSSKQGDLALLHDPIARELLQSTIPARFAYVAPDGTPRVVPIWFHWNGEQVVLGTPATAPKVNMLADGSKVALTIDTDTWPHKVLLIRGTANIETMEGVVPEYAAAAERYLGEEQGRGWVQQAGSLFPKMTRIAIQPEWVGILDFQTRWPRAVAAAMAGR